MNNSKGRCLTPDEDTVKEAKSLGRRGPYNKRALYVTEEDRKRARTLACSVNKVELERFEQALNRTDFTTGAQLVKDAVMRYIKAIELLDNPAATYVSMAYTPIEIELIPW